MTDLPEGFEKAERAARDWMVELTDAAKRNAIHFYRSGIVQGRREQADEVRALEMLAKMRPMKDVDQEEEINKLKAQLAEYAYTPQAYDEMWGRLIETVNKNDELKARIADLVEAEVAIGGWLSAALDDPNVCAEMKQDITRWFTAQETN